MKTNFAPNNYSNPWVSPRVNELLQAAPSSAPLSLSVVRLVRIKVFHLDLPFLLPQTFKWTGHVLQNHLPVMQCQILVYHYISHSFNCMPCCVRLMHLCTHILFCSYDHSTIQAVSYCFLLPSLGSGVTPGSQLDVVARKYYMAYLATRLAVQTAEQHY